MLRQGPQNLLRRTDVRAGGAAAVATAAIATAGAVVTAPISAPALAGGIAISAAYVAGAGAVGYVATRGVQALRQVDFAEKAASARRNLTAARAGVSSGWNRLTSAVSSTVSQAVNSVRGKKRSAQESVETDAVSPVAAAASIPAPAAPILETLDGLLSASDASKEEHADKKIRNEDAPAAAPITPAADAAVATPAVAADAIPAAATPVVVADATEVTPMDTTPVARPGM